jgi:hypothetical protein
MDVRVAFRNERTLRRIVLLLVALAGLAERAAAGSWPVRCFVLWLLRRAETVAAECLIEATGMRPPAMVGVAAVGNGPADALCLAERFHALAAALGALLPLARYGRGPACRRASLGRAVPGFACFQGGWRPNPNDTS